MTLCRLMILDFKGLLQSPAEEVYDEYDLKNGIGYCEGWLALGDVYDEIDHFYFKSLLAWCLSKLRERELE